MGNDDIVRVSCATEGCGTFPMDKALHKRLKRSGNTFTCPAGHRQHYDGDSPESKLRERIQELESKVESCRERRRGLGKQLAKERDRWREAEQLALSAVADSGETGVVEPIDDRFTWACRCGGHGQKFYESREKAQHLFEQHGENTGCEYVQPKATA